MIDCMSIRSPHAGVTITPRMEQRVGQHVAKGDLIAEVHEIRQGMAEIAVREREIGASVSTPLCPRASNAHASAVASAQQAAGKSAQ